MEAPKLVKTEKFPAPYRDSLRICFTFSRPVDASLDVLLQSLINLMREDDEVERWEYFIVYVRTIDKFKGPWRPFQGDLVARYLQLNLVENEHYWKVFNLGTTQYNTWQGMLELKRIPVLDVIANGVE